MTALWRVLRDVPAARAGYIRTRMLLGRSRNAGRGGVHFLVYHAVQAREQASFARQLRLLRDIGDLVSVSQALAALAAPPSQDRHICLTFDDGRRDAFDHALPSLVAAGVPAAFFVVSGWIDSAVAGAMRWADVRQLSDAGMTVGSHSATHRRLGLLDPAAAQMELAESRARIEAATGQACTHFAAPYGQPRLDFQPERDPYLAREAGFRSFFTTIAKMAPQGADVLSLPRVRMEPGWSRAELRYALWR